VSAPSLLPEDHGRVCRFQAQGHVGDVDPLQAIEDALRIFGPVEVIILTAPDEQASWLESGLGERARERFAVPVTHLVTR
jgi:hypothetical protein